VIFLAATDLTKVGRRWNAPGTYAIYGSLEPGLAADESLNFWEENEGQVRFSKGYVYLTCPEWRF
jgi:RES domain-containing protein